LKDKDKWREDNGYGKRWKVEGRYSVFKRIFGEYVAGRTIEAQKKEVGIKVSLMNLFTFFTMGGMMSELA
ncbi:TPA: hypothetical protein DCX16_06100, partial [bacterium]|nr:hypothetical protein [bacterium]